MTAVLQSRDNPTAQFSGPITATLIILEHSANKQLALNYIFNSIYKNSLPDTIRDFANKITSVCH